VQPDRFSPIWFVGVRFFGDVDFSGRQFDGIADFSLARFDEPPRFDTLVNVDLYGAKIGFTSRIPGWTKRGDVATRLRQLRKLADDAKNHDLERDLYIEERKAERGIYFAAHLRGARRNLRQRWRGIAGLRTAAAFPFYVGQEIPSTT